MSSAQKSRLTTFRFDLVILCTLVKLRATGPFSVKFHLISGDILIENSKDSPALEALVGKEVCLSRDVDQMVPMKIYIVGTLSKVGPNRFHILVPAPVTKEK